MIFDDIASPIFKISVFNTSTLYAVCQLRYFVIMYYVNLIVKKLGVR